MGRKRIDSAVDSRTESADWLCGLNLSDFVAIDLETTGLDPTTCEIIEIGAVRFRDGVECEALRSFVRISGALDPFIIGLTGITDDQLANAPLLADVLPGLWEFIADSPLVGQNVDFDLGFLHAALQSVPKQGGTPDLHRRYTLDTAFLTRVFWPEMPGFSLTALCEFFDVRRQTAHRAVDDAKATGEVLVRLIRKLPDRVWSDLAVQLDELIRGTTHRSRSFFNRLQVLASQIRKPSRARIVSRADAIEETDDNRRFDLDELLGKKGLFEQRLPFFQARDSQIRMAHSVADAFERGHILLIEAPTGVGKSLAYLVPSLRWIEESPEEERQVVVSSHTKVLQEQLLRKDIEEVERAVGHPVHAAVLKGRNNYLCKRRLKYLLHEANERLTDLERTQLMPLLRWAELTDTGDIGEISGFSPRHQSFLWAQVTSDGLACAGSACSSARGDFHRAAQERAAKAQIVFINHALLLSDLTRFVSIAKRIVLDEAHQIERAVVAAQTVELSVNGLRATLNRLSDDRGLRGLLHTLSAREDVDTDNTQSAVKALQSSVRQAFSGVAEKLSSMLAPAERSARYRYRYGDRIHAILSDYLQPLRMMWDACSADLQELLAEMSARKGQEKVAPELLVEVRSVADSVFQQTQEFELLLGEGQINQVRWVEFGRGERTLWCSVFSAPVSVGQILSQAFWPVVEGAVLTSATLTVGDSFRVARDTLGLHDAANDRVGEFVLDGPLDLREQMRLFVPTYLPDPRRDDYSHSEGVSGILRTMIDRYARGTLVLCTSNEQVYRFSKTLQPVVKRANRILLNQRSGHSLSELITEFRRRRNAVLIGAASLWEGIDIVGDALQFLMITRLPFDVPTDPWISARSEALQNEGRDPFMEYSLPIAALRLRQGIGRLIRHPEDKGITIITDPRLFTLRYGRTIRESLPSDAIPMNSEVELISQMDAFWKG